jgi:hypothetical protein
MPSESRPSISPELAALWYERTGQLRQMLREDPDGQWAWLWRLRLEILEYLTGRYGSDATGSDLYDAAAPTPPEEALPKTAAGPPLDTVRHTSELALNRGALKDDGCRSDHRARLERLQGINEEVRREHPIPCIAPREYIEAMVLYQRARDAERRRAQTPPAVDPQHLTKNLSYPEAGYEPAGADARPLQDEERSIVERESQAIAALVSARELFHSTDAPLSEDEIAALLGGEQPA